MASTDPGPGSATSLLADPAYDLPRWRDRLERLWRRQVEEIIELSLAYHEAASDGGAAGRQERAGARSRRLQQALARTASAHHALAEIEAALARIDAASYGIASSAETGCERTGWRPARSCATARDAVRRGRPAGIRRAARRARTITICDERRWRGIMRRGLPAARTGVLAAGGR